MDFSVLILYPRVISIYQISKAGRLTLIKSMFSGTSMYYLSLFRAPSFVCKSIEKYMRDFLWKGVGEDHGSHLVNWELVGQPLS